LVYLYFLILLKKNNYPSFSNYLYFNFEIIIQVHRGILFQLLFIFIYISNKFLN